MYAISQNWHRHPNAYKWPQESIDNLLPVDRVNAELRMQVDALNQRLEELSRAVANMQKNGSQSVGLSAKACDL